MCRFRQIVLAVGSACLAHSTLPAEASATGGDRFLLGESGTLRGWALTALSHDPSATVHDPNSSGRNQAMARSFVQYVEHNGSLNLESWVKSHGEGVSTIVAAGRLNLRSPLQGWLLVKVSGALQVTVDNQIALRRDVLITHARGWQAVYLNLSKGEHSIELKCRFQHEPPALAARVIDESGLAPAGAEWWLPFRAAQPSSNAEPFDVAVELAGSAPAGLGLEISAPVGTNVVPAQVATVSLKCLGVGYSKTFNVGQWPNNTAPAAARYLHIGTIDELLQAFTGADNSLSIEVDIGTQRATRWVHLPKVALLAWKRSVQALTENPPNAEDSLDVSRASLQSAQAALSTAVTENHSRFELERTADRVSRLAEDLLAHRFPWTEAGIHELAWRATADSSLQHFSLHVPAGIGDGKPKPLVILLHGYNGTGKHALESFLDIPTDATAAKVDGYVLAPAAHGNAFYRGPGERDVLEILDWAMQALVVDKTRVTIAGASMGGTGTAEIAFHYPDRFAALSPLCGYQSYFVRRDTALQPLRQWERKLMHRFSPASSADAGRYLPMFLAHGLKDKPLENSKVLTGRYRQLGYNLTEDWPDLGHAVWKRTWAHAGLFSWLRQQQRVDDPSRITLAATALRHAKSDWLSLTELDAQAEISQIDAEFKSNHELVVVTKGVLGFDVGTTSRFDAEQPVRVKIDGTTLFLPAHSQMQFHREPSAWAQGQPTKTTLRKVAHVEGPWPELWNEKLAFVYGSLNPATVGTNWNVAKAMAEPTGGADYQYTVVSDQEFNSWNRWDLVPVLIGTTLDNALLSKWAKRLPIEVDQNALVFGGRRYNGDRLGAVFVYPNPDHPTTMVGVVTAPSAEGLWQSTMLPMLLPDFTVFDARVTPAAGLPILGRSAKVLAAGFFNADWSLPVRVNDPLDEN
jgi:poly(3-hydroxybutyrate) depolymerase